MGGTQALGTAFLLVVGIASQTNKDKSRINLYLWDAPWILVFYGIVEWFQVDFDLCKKINAPADGQIHTLSALEKPGSNLPIPET